MCRIFCVGKNYLLHVKEMGHEAPESPVIFLKPYSSSLQTISASRISGNKVFLPGNKISSDIHQETEIVLRVGRDGAPTDKSECYRFIDGVSFGLDLTLRDVQAELKRLGLPWEKSKAFDGSAVVSDFIKYHFSVSTFNLDDLSFHCKLNGNLQQHGNTRDMLFSVSDYDDTTGNRSRYVFAFYIIADICYLSI